MKKLAIILICVCALASCTSTTYLYNWGNSKGDVEATRYEELSYRNYDKQSPESICDLLCLYDYLINNPGGSRGVVPPGIYAEYGYLLLKPETATIFMENATDRQKKTFGEVADYSALFRAKGLEYLEKEMILYPESATFLAPILESFKNR